MHAPPNAPLTLNTFPYALSPESVLMPPPLPPATLALLSLPDPYVPDAYTAKCSWGTPESEASDDDPLDAAAASS